MYEKAEDGVPDMQFECDDERYGMGGGIRDEEPGREERMAEHGLPDAEQGRETETGKQKARTAAEPTGNSAGRPAGLLSGFEAGLLSGFEVACLECQFYAAQGFFPAQNLSLIHI